MTFDSILSNPTELTLEISPDIQASACKFFYSGCEQSKIPRQRLGLMPQHFPVSGKWLMERRLLWGGRV
jgi:hypothetical protein